tara:strand:+ start:11642 stop:12322 length:681 start_codon:yes stop_codon:yes gene_type:complete
MNNFSKDIAKIFYEKQNEKLIIFDIGCFKGNFSRSIKKELKNSQFYLFDANNSINSETFNDLETFKFFPFAVYDEETDKDYFFNTFFPASGSSIDSNVKNDFIWKLTRKIITLDFFGKFEKKKVKTITLNSFCKKNSIDQIDILKIDVEGSELNVLKGSDLILKKTRCILVEITDTKNNFLEKYNLIIDFLKKKNFKLLLKKNIISYSILSNQEGVDALFINEEFK